jgi:hypothetical protein
MNTNRVMEWQTTLLLGDYEPRQEGYFKKKRIVSVDIYFATGTAGTIGAIGAGIVCCVCGAPGRSSIDVGARFDEDRIASRRLVVRKHAAITAVARVSRFADPRVVIRPPIVPPPPPPIPSAPPSLRCSNTTITRPNARKRWIINRTWIMSFQP